MKLKKWLLPLCLIALLLSCFTGCGNTMSAKDTAAMEPAEGESPYLNGTSDGGGVNYDEYDMAETADESTSTEPLPDAEAANNNLKLIYTVNMTVETLDYESSVQSVEALTEQFGGYIEYSQVENDHINSHWLRSASYTLRVPAAKLDDFLNSCGDVGNVCSIGKETENRTTEYTDLSSRLETLRIEEKSLQALLEDAQDLDTVVALHGYLSDVRYEIEQIQTRMRGIDGLVSYSTVHLNLEEVTVASETITPKSSFGDRLSARFHNSWIDFTEGMENFGVFLLGELPLFLLKLILVLLPFAIVIFIVIVLIRKGRKRRAAKRALAAQNREETPAAPQEPENRQE